MKSGKLNEEEKQWLIENYSKLGKKECMRYLNRSDASIRHHASVLCLKQDKNSDFFKDWQERAKLSKIGKKRPEQALVMKRNHDQGKFLMDDKRKKAISERTKKRLKEKGHPKGMLGKKHSNEFSKIMSERVTKMWQDPNCVLNSSEYRQKLSDRQSKFMRERMKNNTNIYSNAKRGFRDDLGYFVRSGWEANYARYLKWLVSKNQIKGFEYEPDTFWFEEIKRGVRSYLPDFKVTNNDGSIEYHEVKGYMDAKSKTKLSRMKKYYPQVKLILIDQKVYESIKKISKMIPNWEN